MSIAPRLRGTTALVLGASGGLGSACCESLAELGLDIHGVHLDTSERSEELHALEQRVAAHGVQASFANLNAVRPRTLSKTLAALEAGDARVSVLVHALAFGSLGPLVVPRARASDARALTRAQLESTMSVMAHSLVDWVQAIHGAGRFVPGAQVIALTSIGAARVLPAYGAVSAAKAALEAYTRQLAVELAPDEIAVNCVRVGVVDTPALRRIPNAESIVARVEGSSPHQRLTRASELGRFVAAMVTGMSCWTTGSVLAFDGGESLTT